MVPHTHTDTKTLSAADNGENGARRGVCEEHGPKVSDPEKKNILARKKRNSRASL